MRRKSHSTRRSAKSDILDDLEPEPLRSLGEPIPPIRLGSPVRRLKELEDRRNWAPGRPLSAPSRTPARVVTGRQARISHQPKTTPKVIRGPGGKPLQARRSVIATVDRALPRFAEARKTIICFKRKVKREVLHALKRTKSGRGAPKRRNEWSDVQC